MQKYTFQNIKDILHERFGYTYVSGEFKGIKSVLSCQDIYGCMYLCNIDKMINNGCGSRLVYSKNPYSLYNINLFLKYNDYWKNINLYIKLQIL